ncbi:MAG: hypothetical protein JWO67_5260 [Streptosporangiaceae bacterium]|nr:hypothetical protein [Streptosporangiaceae bacterium]
MRVPAGALTGHIGVLLGASAISAAFASGRWQQNVSSGTPPEPWDAPDETPTDQRGTGRVHEQPACSGIDPAPGSAMPTDVARLENCTAEEWNCWCTGGCCRRGVVLRPGWRCSIDAWWGSVPRRRPQQVRHGAGGIGDDVGIAGIGLASAGVQVGQPAHRQAREIGDFAFTGAGHGDRQGADGDRLVDDDPDPSPAPQAARTAPAAGARRWAAVCRTAYGRRPAGPFHGEPTCPRPGHRRHRST